MRSKVAVLKVRPESVLEDTDRLCGLAGIEQALRQGSETILKDNISWHFPFPGANTTPWQLEGTVRALHSRGYANLVCVQNKTVVTDAFKGEDLNGYVPIFKRYGIPVRYNFKPEDMTWSTYKPKAKMLVLDQIFPEGIQIPDAFHGTNIIHLPTVKCVAGTTRVVLGDGTVTTIAELVADQIARASVAHLDTDGTVHVDGEAVVFAMDAAGATRALSATHFSRSKSGARRVVKLTTRTGRTLTATADHPVYAANGWKPIGDLIAGDRVAIARRLSVAGSSQRLPQAHARRETVAVEARGGRTYTAAFAQQVITSYQSGRTTTAIAAAANVRWQSVQHILQRHGVPIRGNVVSAKVPETTSPAFWRWVGYVMAEGCAEDLGKGAGKLWFTNSEPAIRDEFVALTRDLFDVEARVRARGEVSIYSRDLARVLVDLGLPNPLHSGNKRVPELLFRCTDDEIAAFLSGYLDGDGHIATKQAEINATTKSEQLARDLVMLFARLGAVAHVREVERIAQGWIEPRTYHQVSVSGAAVAELAGVLSLRHPAKATQLAKHVERLASSKQPSNWDTVPVDPQQFRGVRTALGLTQASTGRASSVNNIENGYTQPTGRIVRDLLDTFEAADTAGTQASAIAALRAQACPDLAWDHVVSVEVVDGEIDVYDITVPEAGSFVADGVIAHNCHIYTTTTGAMKNAFGGLLNTKRHYTHSWIHQTLVDLLAIQKEIHSGLFAIMDGTTAGDGPGPRTMRPVIKDVMLASEDQVAIDAVAASMMGFDPMSLEYIRLADEAGLGNGRHENIEVVGDTHLADQRWGFSVGDNGASMVGDVMWFGPLKRFQKLFFHTPLVNLFVMGSEAYHDYYRWPLRDRRVFEQWKAETHWGQLFDHYQANGTLAKADQQRTA